MYVKVPTSTADFLIEVTAPIFFDHAAVVIGKTAEWDEKGNLTSLGDTDWDKALQASVSYLHLLEFTADQTRYEAHENMVAFRYVWWHSEKGIEAVITTRPIYIIGENGKTIDRV